MMMIIIKITINHFLSITLDQMSLKRDKQECLFDRFLRVGNGGVEVLSCSYCVVVGDDCVGFFENNIEFSLFISN